MLSKVAKISMETSDTFSQFQMEQSFDALRGINKAQKEAIEEEIRQAGG